MGACRGCGFAKARCAAVEPPAIKCCPDCDHRPRITPCYSDERPDDANLVDQIARTLVEAGCNDPWHTVKRCARALLPLVREQVEATR